MTALQTDRLSATEHFKNSKAEALQPVLKRAGIGAARVIPILIQGETGVGKEVLASAIHEMSGRKGKLIAVNCAAIPADLAEAEFFGHQKGAFTGAITSREGYFRAANGGTIFLDEVGELSLPLQAKLLRVLQEKKVKPVGSDEEHKIDVRIITATNRDLKGMVSEGTFRKDLLYRLNVLTLHMPSLADRSEDIPLLANHFLALHRDEYGFPDLTIDEKAMAKLKAFSWPGNIRELSNVIASSAINAISEERNIILENDIELESSSEAPTLSKVSNDIVRLPASTISTGPFVIAKSILTEAELNMLALESPSARIVFNAACDSMSKIELRAYASIVLRHASQKISAEKLADLDGVSEAVIVRALATARNAVAGKLRDSGYEDLASSPIIRKRAYQTPDQDDTPYAFFNDSVIEKLEPGIIEQINAASLLLNRKNYYEACWFISTPPHVRRKTFDATPELDGANFDGIKKATETFQKLHRVVKGTDVRYREITCSGPALTV